MTESSPRSALIWRTFPARQFPGKTVLAVLTVASLAWGTVLMSGSWLGGLAAGVGLFLVLHRFFFPSWHCIDDAGVRVSTLFGSRSLTWDRVRHVGHDESRVYLSPVSHRSGFDGGQGLLLLLHGNREQVLAAIQSRRVLLKRGSSDSPSEGSTTQ